MNYFGKNIRYLRKLTNMTQEELADKLGYKSFTTIQKWESGNSEPNLKKLKQIAELFNVDIDNLAKIDISRGESNQKSSSYEEQKILDPYNKLSTAGKEKAVSYAWDLVDSNKYITIDRQKMISFLTNAELAALNGEMNLDTMTDDELYTLYSALKEED